MYQSLRETELLEGALRLLVARDLDLSEPQVQARGHGVGQTALLELAFPTRYFGVRHVTPERAEGVEQGQRRRKGQPRGCGLALWAADQEDVDQADDQNGDAMSYDTVL